MKTGLVLEGGAMRGIYTAGVLDVLDEHGVHFDGVIGVSAGALHGCSFVSGQRGRSLRYFKKYRNDKHFMSLWNLIHTGEVVGTQLCYHDIPERLDPFDYEAFLKSDTDFYAVCTNLETGKAEYIRMDNMDEIDYMRASASMPLVSQIVEVGGMKLLDGGVADSVPLDAFRKLGYEKNIVVLTRQKGYRKKPSSMALARRIYRKYPAFVEAMKERYQHYNDTMDEIDRLEEAGEILVIRPSCDPDIGRMDKRPEKVMSVYQLGYADAQAKMEAVQKFLTAIL